MSEEDMREPTQLEIPVEQHHNTYLVKFADHVENITADRMQVVDGSLVFERWLQTDRGRLVNWWEPVRAFAAGTWLQAHLEC